MFFSPAIWRRMRLMPLHACCLGSACASPLISEIHYHPAHPTGAEPISQEWIEIHNPDAAPVDLEGWSLSGGVEFTFPAISIPGGGYYVIAADPATFSALHPGITNVTGGWSGRLANSGETVRLRDASAAEVDQVDYADEGDWATRAVGALDLGHRGWTWDAPHDGGGMTLELINPSLSNNRGQNWASSAVAGGTPGAANSSAESDIAPLIFNVSHSPTVPGSGEAVTVEIELRDEASLLSASATLFWREDGAPTFSSAAMQFDGSDRFAATIPPQADGTIVEFYVSASDGANERSWPAEISGAGHAANALYQVDDSFDPDALCTPGGQPIYYVIMTDAERAELEQIGSTSAEAESNAEMNCTFISHESSSIRVRYIASVRNRGARSRLGPPNNHLVKFRSDDPWEGLEAIKFNALYTHAQVAGSWLYQWLGIEAADSIAVQLRINGNDLAEPGGPRMFGSYARTEALDSDLTAAHWPLDPNGNLYQIRDDEDGGDEGDLRYEGADPDAYRNTYFKQTNSSEDDWSDLIALTDALNNSPASTYLEDVSAVVDVDQWLHFLAVDSLIGNREGGLTTGKGDDFVMYRGIVDPRFKLVPHDLDTLLDQGTRSGSPNLSLFTYDGVDGLEEFLNHPEIVRRYYAKYLEICDSKFRPELINPIIDRAVGGYASAAAVQEMKDFVAARRAGVLAQIPTDYSAAHNLPTTAEGYGRTDSGALSFSGGFHAAFTRSVMVNGQPASLDARAGTWSLAVAAGGGDVLKPGLNRVVITFHEGENGAGVILHREELDVWYNTGTMTEVSGTLTGGTSQGTLHLTTRDNYLPGVPFLVRVDFRNPDGSYARDVWDATASLSTNVPGVLLTPNTIAIRNGLGTALVTAGGGGAPVPVTVLPDGSTWKYLDDGSDQGTAWRASGFDDSTWASGPAQLGYGDGDEDTEVGYGPSQGNKYATTYFRTTFEVADASVVTAVDMRVRYDDGVAIYINGTEFWKSSNMASDMAYDAYTVGGVDTPSEDFQTFNGLPPALLATGTNTIAVEIKQGDGGSSDISFDLELVTQTAGAGGGDPGDFIINASANGQGVSKALSSLTPSPTITTVSGTLAGASSNWSGVVRVTDDVVVPTGHVLNIAPGTLVLVDGDPTPESTAGKDIIVNGTINSLGTQTQPIAFTATVPDNIWGEILFDQCEGATFTFTNIHRAGHSPRGGHTGHGRVLRINGSAVSFEDCNITDNRGKIGQTAAAGGSDSQMTFRRCHWARSVMGIETFDTGVLVEDCFITDMLGIYREDGVTDDNDAIYLHAAGAGQVIILRRLTVAFCDDDGIDTLGADVSIEDAISRDCADKGISIFSEDVGIDGGLFVNNDIGISAKDDARVTLDHVTVADNSSIGIQAEDKDGNDAPSFYTISNSILWGNTDQIRTDYDPADITATYSDIGEAWPGIGNDNADPLFVDAANGDFHLAAGSPAAGAADPASAEPDMGYFPFAPPAGLEVRWTPAGGPYHVTGDITIPVGTTFVVEPGTSVYLDEDTQITINGVAQIVGSPTMRIQFSPVPGAPFVPDPAGNGSLPDGPPKSDGIKIIDSMDPANRIAHIDIGHAQDDNGSIGIIRSQCVVDDVRFYGSKIRMFYTESPSVILENCRFPDVFEPGQQADALGLDNVSEQVKGVGAPAAGGRYIIRNNSFGTTKGHNDVIDVDSGRLPDPIVQVIGNTFTNTGDEHVDLGGDVYVAGNLFHNIFKDDETSDRGYANAISTGDAGSGTTIVVARNIFWDVDHCINLKRDTATIFEHNTVYKIHPDFDDRFGNPSVASVVNLFIPTDTDPNATAGDGAYLANNILAEVPRVFSGADDNKPGEPVPTTPLEMFDNLVDPDISDTSIGPNHPGQTVFDLGTGNLTAEPMFSDPDVGDFALQAGSPALGASSFGMDFGALVPEGIFITGEPPAVTSATDATLTIGGPGIFAYRWRINGGAWSADTPIGNGFDGSGTTVRRAEISLSGLADGVYTVEVEGQDFAGNWQAVPTVSKTWEVSGALPGAVRINEVLADGSAGDDWIELYNPGTLEFDLTGVSISDDPSQPLKFRFADGASLPAGEYLLLDSTTLGFALDADGESVTIFQSGTALDSVAFGLQVTDLSLSRLGHDATWGLGVPTPAAPNVAQVLGDPSGVRINEWLVNGQVTFDEEFIELANTDPLPVEVSGMALTDNPTGDAAAMVLPPLSFIAGGGFAAVRPDGFRLSAEIDQIALFDAGGRLQDALLYGSQTEDYSQGIGADGSTFEHSRLPTPGLGIPVPGSPAEAEYNRALALFDGLRVTEIMFNPPGGTGYEYIELRNIGAVPLDLGGVRFTDGIGFTFETMTLAPGEEVLVVGDLAMFESRYGAGLNVAGTFTGNLSNGGEGITLQLPEPYDAAILRFDFDDGWISSADGEGRALQVLDPTLKRSAWGSAAVWGESPQLGNPDGVVLPVDNYADWALREGVGARDEDPDCDGLLNLVEYALGTDPQVPNSVPAPTTDGGFFLWEITADLLKPDVELRFEWSTGLEVWVPIAFAATTGPLTETLQVSIPTSGGPAAVRLKVSER